MKITIIPAIDIIDGNCVRLTQGDYQSQKVYYKDPLDAAKSFADCGVKRLHMVDLDGAKASQPRNLRVLERVASHTDLQVQYGGGIKNEDALRSVFSAGGARAICGSIAVKEPAAFEQWLAIFGAQSLILGADVRGGKVAVHGWLEDSEQTIGELLDRFVNKGLTQTICTDISRDGMLCGPDLKFYTDLQEAYPTVEVTVSGGISSLDDIKRLNDAGLRSVIVGKAIYEGKITLKQLEQCLQSE